MIRRSVIALALLAALAPAARAQTVDELLAKHYQAQGGLEKMLKVQSWRMTGKMSVGPGMEAPFVMEKKRPGKMRLEFTFSGMTGIQAFDGKTGWAVMPFMGKKDPEPMPEEQLKEMSDQADFDGPLVDWKAKGHTVELVGKESVEGADAYKVKLTKKDGREEFYYLDADSYLIIKEEAKRTMRGTEIEGESSLGDYKDVNGLMVPYSITSGMKGNPQKQTLSMDKIEVDVAIDDSRFAMPAVTASDSTAKAAGDKAADVKAPAAKTPPAKSAAAKKTAAAAGKGK